MRAAFPLSLLAVLASLGAASAQDQGQTPPKEEAKCVTENTSYQKQGNGVALMVELQNDCEQRQRCTVNAYTISAFGARQGQKTMTLAAKSKGAASKNALVIKVRSAGGSTYSSFECKAL
jgi:hypothetical protein